MYPTKFVLLLIGLLLCAFEGQGQDWNLDFEKWNDSIMTPELFDTVVQGRQGIFPSNWFSNPENIPEGKGIGQTTDALKNEYAVALSGFYQYEIMRITTGTTPKTSGWPIDYSPRELNGSYKALLLCSKCDSLRAYVNVYLTSFDDEKQTRDTIGRGNVILKETNNEYQNFSLTIDYIENNSIVPDSITIVLAKRRFGFGNQSVCWECSHVFFDDFSLPDTTSSSAVIQKDDLGFHCYPNPASDHLTITNESTSSKSFQIIDVVGRIYFYGVIESESDFFINTNCIPGGFLLITDGKTTKKILISK